MSIEYNLIDWNECQHDQRYFQMFVVDVTEVLKINYHYNYLSKQLPGFEDSLIRSNNFWRTDLEYSFSRSTLTCLMSNYKDFSQNNSLFTITNFTTSNNHLAKKSQIKSILQVFITFDLEYNYQIILQIRLLTLNSMILCINTVIILYKMFKYFYQCDKCKFFRYESFISFFFEICMGVIGGVSYFLISRYLRAIQTLTNTNCLDNYVQHKIGIFSESLQNSSESNFQIFLIKILKITFIIISIIYYSCAKINLRPKDLFKIIKDNINDDVENSRNYKKDNEED